MPFKDRDRRREYLRDYMRARRAGEVKPHVNPRPLTPGQIHTAAEVLAVLSEQVEALRSAAKLGTAERARVLGYLCSVALRAVEVADVARRLEDLERRLEGGDHAGVN